MAAHKHASMIKAKADNMELVVFVKDDLSGELKWRQMVNSFPISVNHDYFLCLPQHNENDQCLHWFNGGDVEFRRDGEDWQDECEEYHGWTDYCGMMNNDVEFRIKPRKEKRWIGYCASRNLTFPDPQKSRNSAVNYALIHYSCAESEWQFLEIEVEV